MPDASGQLHNLIARHCDELGFAAWGVAPAVPIEYHRELIEWLDADRHGEMRWLENHLAQRIDPRKMTPGAKSIIVVADHYAGADVDESVERHGRIARYARGEDYHRTMKKRLIALADALRESHPDATFRAAVDTAPIMEREHAARAGLGYVGKHTLLIEPGVGSYFFLGEILTTLSTEPIGRNVGDHCGTCTRCIEACPTDAITPYSVDATKCISYLTIEHRSLIDGKFHDAMGDWIFGCDICQEVCPHNGDTDATREARVNPIYHERRQGFDLLEVLNWTEEDRRAAFVKSAMKRAKLDMMKRNALIAAGNYLRKSGDDDDLRARIESLATDDSESDLVRATAQQVIDRLNAG